MRYVIGVDVGTGSARAGLFNEKGELLADAKEEIILQRNGDDVVEQSTGNIWPAICFSVRQCLAESGIAPEQVVGIAYSATCSLVLLDKNHEPLVLSNGAESWDIIVWMDHRAVAEAQECSNSGSTVLNNLGGVMSPEMQIPKLMWLKRHRPDLWEHLGYAGDLSDFLSFKSTGLLNRSVCTLGCKWGYDPTGEGWDHGFLAQMDLDDLLEKAALPDTADAIGSTIGNLTEKAAKELGLTTECMVATGLIDAHAGALGTLGLFADHEPDTRLALIAGTSNCHITLSNARREVEGIWGPYAGAVVNGLWVNEGGQSATGALLDYMVNTFAASKKFDGNVHAEISKVLLQRMRNELNVAGDIMVEPDFNGNRSPFANPKLKGSIRGLTLENLDETFLKVYWATAASIAYGTRLIIDRLNEAGFAIKTLHLSGGHANSELLIRLYADATGCDVLLSPAEEPVLLGAAIAAFAQFDEGMELAVPKQGLVTKPDLMAREMHNERYQKFLKFYE